MNTRLAIVLLLLAPSLSAQTSTPPTIRKDPDFRAAAAKAEALVKEKKFDEADEVLRSAASGCAPDAAGKECRAHLAFAAGYVATYRGDLQRAEQSYAAVLVDYPKNAQALAARTEVYITLAEKMRDARDFGAALGYYRRALDDGAISVAPRLVSAMRIWVGQDPRRALKALSLAHHLRQHGATSAASTAYEDLIALYRESPDVATEALAGWTECRASTGTLDVDALASLPSVESWPSPFLLGLTKTMNGGKWEFSSDATPTVLSKYASVAAAKATADALVASKQQRQALALLRDAIQFAPLPTQQEEITELSWRPVIYLDVALQIARVATALRDNDAFRDLEFTLFNEKMKAYQTNNRVAIQRLHTVLGTIYAERGEWTRKPDSEYTNATFQLSNAIRFAEQPTPQLHELLAKGYRGQNDPDNARAQEIAAAQDYLELDALPRASASIQRAIGPAAGNDPTASALQQIIAYRQSIPTLATTTAVAAPEWNAPGLDASFLERQKFKAYADLAGRAQTLGETAKAEELSVRALDAGAKQKLTGTDDAFRAIRIQTIIEQKPAPKEKTLGTVDYKAIEVAPATLAVSPAVLEKYQKSSSTLTNVAKTRVEKKDQDP